jgi:hypothetical protein
MNLKQKLLICNANINFNKTCLNENLIPKYAKLNQKVYSNNIAAIKTKGKAQYTRIKYEIKLLYRKKQEINQKLYKAHLYNANNWTGIWGNIEQNINQKIEKKHDEEISEPKTKIKQIKERTEST